MASPLSHLSPDDHAAFHDYGFGPTRAIPFPVVHHAFEHHARTQPHAIAVEHTLYNHALTYEQLDRQANRLARRLRAEGVRHGDRVCILAHRSVLAVAATLAVLKAGAQYVPTDAVTVTAPTLTHILRDAAPRAVLVMREYAHRVQDARGVLLLEDAVAEDEQMGADASKMEDETTAEDGCYVIYTSGTTGVPKGVDVRHRGVSNVISGSPGNISMRPGLRVAQLLNIAFDMGAWEILGALYNGCTLCLRGNTSVAWAALLRSVDVVICTPSILARHDPRDYPNLQHVFVGGEACPQALADDWATHTQFNTGCGPTEISIANTVYAHTPGVPVAIGRPIPNTAVYILAAEDAETSSLSAHVPRALPIGQTGCMWVGGVGVSNGYLNLLHKTAERWRPDPFWPPSPANPRPMMVNTGDLGSWRPGGLLAHHGRLDDQIKVKGFRVELAGITHAILSVPEVSHAAALLVGEELWAFVAPSGVDLVSVRERVRTSQPYYAVPSEWVSIGALPLTKNGKVDREALKTLALASQEGGEAGEGSTGAGAVRRLSVRNGGVPFSASLPGTPMVLAEQGAAAWAVPSTAPSPSLQANSQLPTSTPPLLNGVKHTSSPESLTPSLENHTPLLKNHTISSPLLRNHIRTPSSSKDMRYTPASPPPPSQDANPTFTQTQPQLQLQGECHSRLPRTVPRWSVDAPSVEARS